MGKATIDEFDGHAVSDRGFAAGAVASAVAVLIAGSWLVLALITMIARTARRVAGAIAMGLTTFVEALAVAILVMMAAAIAVAALLLFGHPWLAAVFLLDAEAILRDGMALILALRGDRP